MRGPAARPGRTAGTGGFWLDTRPGRGMITRHFRTEGGDWGKLTAEVCPAMDPSAPTPTPTPGGQPPKLLDRLRAAIRVRH